MLGAPPTPCLSHFVVKHATPPRLLPIDPLFSPTVLEPHNVETDVVHRAGSLAEDVVLASFGMG